MIDQTSRYASAKQEERTDAQGRAIRYIVPPILPHPDDQTNGSVTVTDTDRPDTIAARQYGQATAWWMIANGNTAAHPDQLIEESGEALAIPMPDGVGGPTG